MSRSRQLLVAAAGLILAGTAVILNAPTASASCAKDISTSDTYTKISSAGCTTEARIKKVINGSVVTTDGNVAFPGYQSAASDSRGYIYGNYVRWQDGSWTSWKSV
jgi:hypothetical protein